MNSRVRRFKKTKDFHTKIFETSPSGRKYFIYNGNFRINKCLRFNDYYIDPAEHEKVSNLSSEEKQNILNRLKDV